MNWREFKGLKPWQVVKPLKWGYLNNKRWSDIPEAVTFSQSKGYSIDPTYAHEPCGHWHLPEIIPPIIEQFPVGRLLGWESLYAHPYAFGYDTDYCRIVRIDLTTLTANDYTETIDPDWGKSYLDGIVIGVQPLVLDNCFRYIYMIFSDPRLHGNSGLMKIWKVDPLTMDIVDYMQTSHLGVTHIDRAHADMQYIYLNPHPLLMILSTNLSYPETEPRLAYPWGSEGIPPVGGIRCLHTDPNYGVLYWAGSTSVEWGGTVWAYVKDLSPSNSLGLKGGGGLFRRDSWFGPMIFNPLTGVGLTCSTYHPFSPRYYVWSRKFGSHRWDYGTHEEELFDALTFDGAWCNAGFVVAGSNFYPAYNVDRYYTYWVGLGTSSAFWWQDIYNHNKLPGDLFQEGSIRNHQITCDKRGNKTIIKSIGAYQDPLFGEIEHHPATYLTRVTYSGAVEEFRKRVLGYKVTVPARVSDLEPQVWAY